MHVFVYTTKDIQSNASQTTSEGGLHEFVLVVIYICIQHSTLVIQSTETHFKPSVNGVFDINQ